MALTVLRNIDQLKEEVTSLGYALPDMSGRAKKEQLIKILQQHNLKSLPEKSLPMELMLELGHPMVCSRLNQLKKEEQEAIWEDPNVYFELKEDGHRNVIFVIDREVDHFSRHLSVSDYLPISYKEKILMYLDRSKIKNNFVLDFEVISVNPMIKNILRNKGIETKTQLQAVSSLLALNSKESLLLQQQYNCPLQFHVFDCLWWEGEWMLSMTLKERRKYLLEGFRQLQAAGMNIKLVPSSLNNKKAFYNNIIDKGLEGVVAKRIDSLYYPSENRGHKAWVKIKNFMDTRLKVAGISDTIDGFVTGFIPGTPGSGWEDFVGALQLSIYIDDGAGNRYIHYIATPANFNKTTREEMTVLDHNGKPVLREDWYNKVFEFNGQTISSRSKRFRHATVIRERNDKPPAYCVYPESLIKDFIL